MDTPTVLLVGLVASFVLVAAAWDLRTRRLPNWLTVSGLAAAVVFQLARGASEGGFAGAAGALGTAAAGFATGFGILLVLWLTGGGGAGDVKLMGALGAWLGPLHTVYVFLLSALFAVPLGIGAIVYQRFARRRGRASTTTQVVAPRGLVPYAVPVAVGTWAVLLLRVLVVHADAGAQHVANHLAR